MRRIASLVLLLVVGVMPALAEEDISISASEHIVITDTQECIARVEAVQQPGERAVVVIPRTGQQFLLRLRFLADTANNGKLAIREQMQRAVLDASQLLIVNSVERKAEFKPLRYAGREGVYATFTDPRLENVKEPPPLDYRNAVVGVIRLSDDAVLQYVLLVNNLNSQDYFTPLHYALSFVKPVDEATTRP